MSRDVLVGHTPQPAFRDLYPTATAGQVNKVGQESLPDNIEGDVFLNADLVYCKKCGYPCRLDRDERHDIYSDAGKGIGLVQEDTSLDWVPTRTIFNYKTGANDITGFIYNPDASGGCPFCGTYLYDVNSRMKD